jgi:hypothetical protein
MHIFMSFGLILSYLILSYLILSYLILSMNQRRSLLSSASVTIVSSGPRPRALRTEQLNCENHTREEHLTLSLVERLQCSYFGSPGK